MSTCIYLVSLKLGYLICLPAGFDVRPPALDRDKRTLVFYILQALDLELPGEIKRL